MRGQPRPGLTARTVASVCAHCPCGTAAGVRISWVPWLPRRRCIPPPPPPRSRTRAPSSPTHRRRALPLGPSSTSCPAPCCHPRWALGLPVGWACALPWPAPRTPAPLASPPSPLRARIFSPRRPRAPCPSRVHCVLPVVAHGPCLRCCPTRTAHRAWASVLCQRAYRVGLYACGSAARAPRVEPVHPCHAPVATVRAAHTCV